MFFRQDPVAKGIGEDGNGCVYTRSMFEIVLRLTRRADEGTKWIEVGE